MKRKALVGVVFVCLAVGIFSIALTVSAEEEDFTATVIDTAGSETEVCDLHLWTCRNWLSYYQTCINSDSKKSMVIEKGESTLTIPFGNIEEMEFTWTEKEEDSVVSVTLSDGKKIEGTPLDSEYTFRGKTNFGDFSLAITKTKRVLFAPAGTVLPTSTPKPTLAPTTGLAVTPIPTAPPSTAPTITTSAVSPTLTPTPVLTAVPTQTPTPSPTPSATPSEEELPPLIPPHYIIGAVAVIAIILIAGIVISRKGKRDTNKTKKPHPPAEPPKHEPKIKPTSPKPEQAIRITSAFGYKGATIVHKIKVENPTSEPMSDIKIHLFVPDVFLLKEQEKHIALLKPKESKTVSFEIRPTGECGDCEVSGSVIYYDYASKKTKEVDIPAKTLSIVCPVLKLKKIDEDAWRSVVSDLAKTEENTKEIDMSAKTLFKVTSDILRDMNMFMLPPTVTETPQLYRATARFYAEGVKELKYAAQIEVVGGTKKSKLILKAWAEKEEALTGFYHGLLDEIEKRVQVKGYIEDSIVQQFYHIGDRIGTVVKDTVMVRSTIGTGKKCPSCGRNVSENERVCPFCSELLK